MKNKILIIAPHLDDEVLGCGGTISSHVCKGDIVHVLFVANRVYEHVFDAEKMRLEISHMEKAKLILGYQHYTCLDFPDEQLYLHLQGIIIGLERIISQFKPSIVYSPFYQDNNQDHRAVADAVRVALRPSAVSFVRRWLMYEIPSSTEQSPPLPGYAFQPNYYIDILPFLDAKLEALACYETEARPFPHPRSPEAIRNLATKRGSEVLLSVAEAFVLLREIQLEKYESNLKTLEAVKRPV